MFFNTSPGRFGDVMMMYLPPFQQPVPVHGRNGGTYVIITTSPNRPGLGHVTMHINYTPAPETRSELRAAVNALRVGIGLVCLSQLFIISRRQSPTFLSSLDMAASVP